MQPVTTPAAASSPRKPAVGSRKSDAERRKAERRRVAEIERGDGGMRHGADMGSPLAIERGSVVIDRSTHILHDPDDKRSGAVIGARAQRVWVPDRMVGGRSPSIGPEQYDAGVRYYDDYLLGEEGARRNQARGGSRLDPWARCPYSEVRAMRRQSFRMATQALGPLFSPAVVWCVLQITPNPSDPPTIEAWARSVDWDTKRAVGWLAGALAALAMHYGYTRRNTPSVNRAEAEAARRARGAP